MKTAIIFFGFFRTFDFVKNTLADNVMSGLNCDVYFSTPETMFTPPEGEVPEFHHIHSQNNDMVGDSVINFFGDKLKKFELRHYDAQLYKNLITSNNIPFKSFCDQYTWRILASFHSVYCSLELFKKYVESNSINYDMVILARGDVKYHSKLNMNELQMDKINYPTDAVMNGHINRLPPNARPSPSLEKAFNDQMLIGTQKNILTFHSLYENIFKYFHSGIDFNHETMMGIHLRKNNVEWVGTNYILYELWRYCKY